jgi:hypothetical protein
MNVMTSRAIWANPVAVVIGGLGLVLTATLGITAVVKTKKTEEEA